MGSTEINGNIGRNCAKIVHLGHVITTDLVSAFDLATISGIRWNTLARVVHCAHLCAFTAPVTVVTWKIAT